MGTLGLSSTQVENCGFQPGSPKCAQGSPVVSDGLILWLGSWNSDAKNVLKQCNRSDWILPFVFPASGVEIR